MKKNIFFNNFIFYKNRIINNKKDLIQTIKGKNKISGQFSFFFKDRNFYYVGRDELGAKKIFFSIKNNKIFFSKNFLDFRKNKLFELSKIFSAPQNAVIKIYKNKIVEKFSLNSNFVPKKINLKIEINKKLNFFFKSLKKKYSTAIILLSGGLDSVIIANFAKKYFKERCYAITASYKSKNIKKNLQSRDLKTSKLVCKKLNINHSSVFFDDKYIKKNLVKILYSCQDWRDYNVHCAVINFVCAEHIKKNFYKKRIVVLTGDFMNEYFSDYGEVKIEKNTYYNQLKKDNKVKQRFFIKGLDSSARETGVFEYFNLPIFQPFSIVKPYYEKLNLKQIKNKNSKYKFNKFLLPKNIFKLVNPSKIRAQYDPITGGVISFFYRNKIDQKKLIKIFNKKFKTNNLFLKNFINLGTYRTIDI